MLFRFHRGGFQESMDTVISINNLEQLKFALEIEGKEVKNIRCSEHNNFDARNHWYTYNIHVLCKGSKEYEIAGYSDGVLS